MSFSCVLSDTIIDAENTKLDKNYSHILLGWDPGFNHSPALRFRESDVTSFNLKFLDKMRMIAVCNFYYYVSIE